MHRPWLRLVSYLSLAAFLLANQPAAMTAFVRGGGPGHVHEHSPDCWHCSCLKQETAVEPSACDCAECCSEAPAGSSLDPSQPASTSHDHSSCPCCPCPGGCAYCSVAKVPCCHARVAVGELILSLEEGCAESTMLLPPAHSGKLIRPPKA